MQFLIFHILLKDGSFYGGFKLVDHPKPEKVVDDYFRRIKKRFGRRHHSSGITHLEMPDMFHKRSGKLLFRKYQKLKRAFAADTNVAGRKTRITDGKPALAVGVLLDRERNYNAYLEQEIEKEKQARAPRRKEREAAPARNPD